MDSVRARRPRRRRVRRRVGQTASFTSSDTSARGKGPPLLVVALYQLPKGPSFILDQFISEFD
ncbi:MAG: hypothetical protein AAGC55_25680, partial [Myxococcota bacterium]